MTTKEPFVVVFALVLQVLGLSLSDSNDVYATAGNPKTPEKEIMAAPGDPNPQIVELSVGGICAIGDNIKALEEQLEVDFTEALEDKIKIETIKALNDTAAFINSNTLLNP